MPFGLKKGDDGDLDSKKASLFGKSSNKLSKSPAPGNNPYAVPPSGNSNPYANQAPAGNGNPYANQAPANDPYASRGGANPYASQHNDPYARSQSSFSQPPTSSFGSLTLNSEAGYNQGPGPNRYEKSPVPPGGYGGRDAAPAPAPRYGREAAPTYQSQGSYGQTGGYGQGADPYGNAPPQYNSRPGGYGGMGRSESQDTVSTDAGRNALFGDAPQRAAQQQASHQQYGGGDSSYNNAGGYDADSHGGYGAPPDRELTAEEQEDQEVEATKGQIRFIKQQDVASTRNARRIAEQSEMIGRDTLARLGAQGERIHNTERNLDLASNQNLLAEEKARELKTLNRSMFAVHVANPFTAKKREEAANALALEKRQQERGIRDATQAEAYSSQARAEKQNRDVNGNVVRKPAGRSLADRAKYQFEADSEDDEMENEIDDNLDAIHRSAKTLNTLGRAMGEEIESQNRHLTRVTDKTDRVDDQIAVNRARLDRIR